MARVAEIQDFIVNVLGRMSEDLVGRVSGPMQFRLLLQPLMATVFAVRSGLGDARAGRPPYFWSMLSMPEHRRQLLQSGWKDVGKVFVMAIVIDVVYQVVALQWVYPVEALLTAALLAILPYLLIRIH